MSGKPCFTGTTEHSEVRFTLVGLVASPEFQQCLTVIELLHKKYPARFIEPFIRPMLEFEWIEYLIKAQRTYGGMLWHLERPFIIYVNDQPLGCDDELEKYLLKWYHVHLDKDFYCMAQRGLVDMYEKYMELGRQFAFFSIAIEKKIIGHMIFMLYGEIVPKTCRNFIKKCNSKRHGYRGTRLHRLMDSSWIQCADYTLPLDSMANENYVVPHNRRGVLSMCNNNPHWHNKTQFFITLDATPWMDYKYVAFGQLMQGEYVLRQLERLQTLREDVLAEAYIANCGEITLEDTLLTKNIPKICRYLDERSSKSSLDYHDVRDVPSILLEDRYRRHLYCYFDDGRSNLPLVNIPNYMMTLPSPSQVSTIKDYFMEEADAVVQDEEDAASVTERIFSTDAVFYQHIKQMLSLQSMSYKYLTQGGDAADLQEEEGHDHHDLHEDDVVAMLEQYLYPSGHSVHKGESDYATSGESEANVVHARSVQFAEG